MYWGALLISVGVLFILGIAYFLYKRQTTVASPPAPVYVPPVYTPSPAPTPLPAPRPRPRPSPTPAPAPLPTPQPTPLPSPPPEPEVPRFGFVTVYGNNDCIGTGKEVYPGTYSCKGRGGHDELTFNNDWVRCVNVPKGMHFYATDKDSFNRDGEVFAYRDPNGGPAINLGNLAGKVSSFAVWKADQPAPAIISSTTPEEDWARFCEGDNGKGDCKKVTFGSYTYKGRNNYPHLPFPNDWAKSVTIPAGISIYATDHDSFQEGGRRPACLVGPKTNVNLGDVGGKVSSVAVWRTGEPRPRGAAGKASCA